MTTPLEARLRWARRRLLFEPDALPRLEGGAPLVQALLPHRGSMLLVDELLGADLAAGRILGRRRVDGADPVFAGHFPGDPVYPGALQMEAVGQCGLCLPALRRNGVTTGAQSGAPSTRTAQAAGVRLVRILAADFLEAVRPGAEALLLAELVDDVGLTVTTVGQMVVDGRPTCVCAFEAMILEDEEADA
jgi:3-hydroxymyristoyl/3-hydroxydecanoyl-(acyl carrier protein) dehydratase